MDKLDNFFVQPKAGLEDYDFTGVTLTDEFTEALELLENTNESFFLTGDAGTGKSTLINLFAENTKKRVVKLAPTGIASVNIGGQTIHSFFGLPPKALTEGIVRTNVNKRLRFQDYRMLINKVDTIIVDEISMVRSDMMDAIDIALRIITNNNASFGGKQIVCVGDLNQLPPVVAGEADKDFIQNKYDSPFFFNAKCFEENMRVVYLRRNFRQQDDKEFIELLNRMKNCRMVRADIDMINHKLYSKEISKDCVTLTSTNSLASVINDKMMNSIDAKMFTFKAEIEGYFDPKYCRVDEYISLKEGCRVMTMNNDPSRRWFNGSLGTVIKIHDNAIGIEFDNGKTHFVERISFDNMKYRYNYQTDHIETESKGTFKQFPLKLAYAITIHKSQGKTFEHINIDFDSGAFAHGQAYVAFSRCKTFDGISISRQITLRDFIYDRRVLDFQKEFFK